MLAKKQKTMKFTYDSYLDLIDYVANTEKPLYLRHDVDVSLKKACELAEIEAQNEISALYCVLFTSPHYNVLSPENIERLKMLREMGHNIGLHFDLSVLKKEGYEVQGANAVWMSEILENITGKEVHYITWHRPTYGTPATYDMITAMQLVGLSDPNFNKEFKYVSDSGHNWRENPYDAVDIYQKIHINTHPEWYNKDEQSWKECLHNLALEVESEKKLNAHIKEVDIYRKKLKSKGLLSDIVS